MKYVLLTLVLSACGDLARVEDSSSTQATEWKTCSLVETGVGYKEWSCPFESEVCTLKVSDDGSQTLSCPSDQVTDPNADNPPYAGPMCRVGWNWVPCPVDPYQH